MKIILDTNFLIDAIRFKIDIFSELAGYDLYILDSIVNELKIVEKRGTSESNLAKLALKLLSTKDLKALKPIERKTDESLLAYSQQNYAIATQDSLLRHLIKEKKGKLVYIRQGKYVVIE